jgi:FkbM family methyltransferase
MKRPHDRPLIVKRIMYIFDSFKLIAVVKNWPLIPLGILGIVNFKKGCVLNLRDGLFFKIHHPFDALTIKETCYENDYHLKHSLKGLTIIDVGANIGDFAVFAAFMNPNSKVFAYEPSHKTFKQLSENIYLNKMTDRIVAVREAVGGGRGRAKLYDSGVSGVRSLFRARKEKKFEVVNIVTLNDVFERNKLKRCDFLKIDCEGGEYNIFQNTKKDIFEKIKQISMEFHEMLPGQNHQELVQLLRNVGYKVKYGYHNIESNIGYIHATR